MSEIIIPARRWSSPDRQNVWNEQYRRCFGPYFYHFSEDQRHLMLGVDTAAEGVMCALNVASGGSLRSLYTQAPNNGYVVLFSADTAAEIERMQPIVVEDINTHFERVMSPLRLGTLALPEAVRY